MDLPRRERRRQRRAYDEDAPTCEVAAVLGAGPAVLLTVRDAEEARAEAAALLVRHFVQVSEDLDVSALSTEEYIAHEALHHRVLQDALGACHAGLGDAIRAADAQGLYGRGRPVSWIELATSLDLNRDTVGEIRAGKAWQGAATKTN
ncbi:hypothetical protein [Kitasatospora sp. NPDC008115]|uniref:hypothetical protein n=1 Tax=Kitasatospora sp. NPDC008115 TaxID=3364022 RepID=UPI0036E0532A